MFQRFDGYAVSQILFRLKSIDLQWFNLRVMRRTPDRASDGADPKMMAGQLGHSVDASLPIVNQLEKRLAVQWCSSSAQAEGCSRKLL